MSNRSYTFKSGYKITVKDTFDVRLYELAMQSWREENPEPEPPALYKEVPQKGGMVQRKVGTDWNNPTYVQNHATWQIMLITESAKVLYRLAFDGSSLDDEAATVIHAGREWAEENGVSLPNDDVRAYLTLVSDYAEDDPEGDGTTEMVRFNEWVRSIDSGVDGALVNRFRDRLRADIQKAKNTKRVEAADG